MLFEQTFFPPSHQADVEIQNFFIDALRFNLNLGEVGFAIMLIHAVRAS